MARFSLSDTLNIDAERLAEREYSSVRSSWLAFPGMELPPYKLVQGSSRPSILSVPHPR